MKAVLREDVMAERNDIGCNRVTTLLPLIFYQRDARLQEIIWGALLLVPSSITWASFILDKALFFAFFFAHFHDCCLVATSVAVVWRRKKRNHCLVVVPHVAFHHELMRTCNETAIVRMVKLLAYVLPESVACATRRNTPSSLFIRVGPKRSQIGPSWGGS